MDTGQGFMLVWRCHPSEKKNNNNNNTMKSDIRSVPDPKIFF